MGYKISKELLSSVLGVNILEYTQTTRNVYFSYTKDNITYTGFSINIHELADKCKKWALACKYTITPIVILSGKDYLRYILEVKSFHNPSIDRKAFTYFRHCTPKVYNSEQQAVFDACQWILDNKGKL